MGLIDRQAAIDEAKEWIDAVYFEETDKRERKAIECVIGSLKELPSVDAEPVRHGRWTAYVISMIDGEGCKCSECGFEGVPYWDYCPNCGARMDGD